MRETTKTKNSAARSEPDTYFQLVREFSLKAIHSESEYGAAVGFLGSIEIASRTGDPGGRDYAATLADVIEEYEGVRGRIDPSHVKPLDSLKFLMNQRAMNITSLGKIIGSQGTACEVFSGQRQISKAMARKLGDHFKIDCRIFL